MIIDKFEALILKNSYYLLWVQDSEFNNISSVFILSTYNNDVDMLDYNYNRNEAKLKAMSAMFSGKHVKAVDDKLRTAAGKPLDDELVGRK